MKFEKIKISKDQFVWLDNLKQEICNSLRIPKKYLYSKIKLNLKNKIKVFIIHIRVSLLNWKLQRAYKFRNRVVGDMFMPEYVKQSAEKDIVTVRDKIYKLEEKIRKVGMV
jgi:hypothetical protein